MPSKVGGVPSPLDHQAFSLVIALKGLSHGDLWFNCSMTTSVRRFPLHGWAGLALGLMRPYRDSIRTAMKRVFAALELPWVTRNSQTAAVMLAMFGGLFGLHCFYLGDRRRLEDPLQSVTASRQFDRGLHHKQPRVIRHGQPDLPGEKDRVVAKRTPAKTISAASGRPSYSAISSSASPAG